MITSLIYCALRFAHNTQIVKMHSDTCIWRHQANKTLKKALYQMGLIFLDLWLKLTRNRQLKCLYSSAPMGEQILPSLPSSRIITITARWKLALTVCLPWKIKYLRHTCWVLNLWTYSSCIFYQQTETCQTMYSSAAIWKSNFLKSEQAIL